MMQNDNCSCNSYCDMICNGICGCNDCNVEYEKLKNLCERARAAEAKKLIKEFEDSLITIDEVFAMFGDEQDGSL